MEKIIFFAIPMIVTIPFTLLLCRIRLALKLRISFATVLFSALVVSLLWLGFATQWDIYTVGFWHGHRPKPPDRPLMIKTVPFTIIICTLPALSIVHFYQRRSKTDDRMGFYERRR